MVLFDGMGATVVTSRNVTFLERSHNGGGGQDRENPAGATLGRATTRKVARSAGSSGWNLMPTRES